MNTLNVVIGVSGTVLASAVVVFLVAAIALLMAGACCEAAKCRQHSVDAWPHDDTDTSAVGDRTRR